MPLKYKNNRVRVITGIHSIYAGGKKKTTASFSLKPPYWTEIIKTEAREGEAYREKFLLLSVRFPNFKFCF